MSFFNVSSLKVEALPKREDQETVSNGKDSSVDWFQNSGQVESGIYSKGEWCRSKLCVYLY